MGHRIIAAAAFLLICVLFYQMTRGGNSDRIHLISTGQRVSIEDNLPNPGRAVVQFTAKWCPGCRQIEPHVEELLDKDEDLIILRIDIDRWGSPVAEQYGINLLPHLEMYEDGQRIAEGVEQVFLRAKGSGVRG